MTDNQKQKSLQPVRPPRTKAEREHWGEIPKGPERYPDTPGKRFGNWLLGWLTPWQR